MWGWGPQLLTRWAPPVLSRVHRPHRDRGWGVAGTASMTTLDGSDGPSCCDSLGSRFTLHPRPHQSAGLREKAKRHSKSRSPHPDPPGLLTPMATH